MFHSWTQSHIVFALLHITVCEEGWTSLSLSVVFFFIPIRMWFFCLFYYRESISNMPQLCSWMYIWTLTRPRQSLAFSAWALCWCWGHKLRAGRSPSGVVSRIHGSIDYNRSSSNKAPTLLSFLNRMQWWWLFSTSGGGFGVPCHGVGLLCFLNSARVFRDRHFYWQTLLIFWIHCPAGRGSCPHSFKIP